MVRPPKGKPPTFRPTVETLEMCRCGFAAHLLAEREAEPKGFLVLCDHCWRRGPITQSKWLSNQPVE